MALAGSGIIHRLVIPVQKNLKTIAVAECLPFIGDSLRSSDEVASFIKLPVIRKFYYHCLKNLKAPIVIVNVTRLKENLLNVDPYLEATSYKKEVFISFGDDLAVALEYSWEHSLQNNVIHLNRAGHVIHFNTLCQKGNQGASHHTSA